MSDRAFSHGIIIGCMVLASIAAFPRAAQADLVDGGFDMFDPLSGSLIFVPTLGRLVPVIGVPIVSFPDFGPAPLGDTNSILRRANTVSDSGPTQTPVQMLAMQLMSTDGSNLFFTLQSCFSSTGVLNVQFGPAPTFTWDIDLFFDVKTGGGGHLDSFNVDIAAGPTPWSHIAPPGAVCIPGTNCLLNGTNNAADFFPTGNFTATGRNGTSIIFDTALAVPEPGTAVLVTIGLGAMAVTLNRRRSRNCLRRLHS